MKKKKYPGTPLALRLDVLQDFIDASASGRSRAQLRNRLGISRSTAYRVIDDLKNANVRFHAIYVEGEERLRVFSAE